MNQVTMKKAEVLEVLRKNREQHKKIFLEAVEGYRKKAIDMLEKHVADIRYGKVFEVYVSLPRPEEHTRDYDRVIKMIEMAVEDNVVFTEQDTQNYIMDDWAWKQKFLTTNSAYSGTAATAMQFGSGELFETPVTTAKPTAVKKSKSA